MTRPTRAAAAKAKDNLAETSSVETKKATPAQKAKQSKSKAKAPPQLSSPPSTPSQVSKVVGDSASLTPELPAPAPAPATPATSGRKRTRKSIKQEDEGEVDELPHNLGTALPTPGADWQDYTAGPPTKRAKRGAKQTTVKKADEDEAEVKLEDDGEYEDGALKKTPKKKGSPVKGTPKKANYGLTPGTSPYPDYERPTPEECREVVRVLEKQHGKVVVPKAIPPPSLDVAGCGEVPSVLDALIRTRLSANTTNKNSSTAFQGLVARFGVLKEGIGKGSVDWDAVRLAPQKDVFEAIRRGGLADIKSKDIQKILQMVYEENQERKAALLNPSDNPAGADKEPESEKQQEITKAKQNIISLDHLHLLSTDDAISQMLTYPGIGPKTASCVALFCLQRPSFAVDTHVFRLCKYLGWVPKTTKKGQPKVDRNTTFSHCDVRIPDELKYPLHYLLIKHGKLCPRCRAATGETSANWDAGCPIEHLVKRHGAKKGGMSLVARKKAAAAAGEGDGDIKAEEEEDGALSDASDGDEEGEEEDVAVA